MRLSHFVLVLPLLLVAGLPARAASSSFSNDQLRVELLVPGDSLYHSDELNNVGLYFKLEPGWHIYWMNPGDAGEPPHVKWTLPVGISAGPMQFPAPKRLPLGPLMDYGYEDEVLFPLKLHIANGVKAGPVTLHAKVDWLVCRGSCIPGKAELEVNLKVIDHPANPTSLTADSAIFRRFAASIPKPLPKNSKPIFQVTMEEIELEVNTGRQETEATFFPEDQDIIDNPAPQKFDCCMANGLTLELKKDPSLKAPLKQLRGILKLSGGRSYEIVALPGEILHSCGNSSMPKPVPSQATPASIVQTNLAATTQVANQMQQASFAWLLLFKTAGLAFLGGLLLNLMPCVFPVLFLKGLALVNSGNEERAKLRTHGLVYAVGILVSFWALVAVLLGLRAAGSTLGWGFQFQSPVFLSLMAGLLFFLGLSLAGQFEIGLTLTSAGGALAQKQGYTGSFFTGVLAVVVATPCTAPFMGAAIGYALAQSALVTFVIFTALALGLAVPYVALTLQPAWTRWLPKPGVWMEVLRQAVAVPIFLTVIWLAWVLTKGYGADLLWTLLGSFLLLAIAGWFLGRWPARRWATAVAAVLLLGVIALAVVGQKMPSNSASAASQPSSSAIAASGWEPWSAEAVCNYQAQGRPVFVDFTASWCLSCQVNERVALNQPEVQRAFADRKVALLRADWTRHDEAITQALTALGRSGVPAYALYAPGETTPRLLPEVLTPGIVMDALAKLPSQRQK
jgi:thiol:disulfide interchange protein DsbD